MKWFKHMSDMRNDLFVKKLIDTHGLRGYAVWNLLLEVYAQECGSNPGQEIEISTKILAKECHVSVGKLMELCRFFVENSTVLCRFSDGNSTESRHVFAKTCHLQIPRMASLRDNHTGNLQVAGKLLGPKNKEERVKNIEITSSPLPPPSPEEAFFEKKLNGVNNPYTEGKTFFTIRKEGVRSSELEWIFDCLLLSDCRKNQGWGFGEYLQLYPYHQKTYNRWMAYPIHIRMLAYEKTINHSNAKNELTYALKLAEKSETDFTIFGKNLETFRNAVENNDLEVEISG